MRRRDMIKGVVAGLFSLGAVKKVKASNKKIVETRTRAHIDKLDVWDEAKVLHEFEIAEQMPIKEYLFIGGGAPSDREETTNMYIETTGGVFVYSPRWLIQKGHFYDIIFVEIGDKNITSIQERFKTGRKKLPDCMNR